MVAAGGFQADEDGVLGEPGKLLREFLKPLHVHQCREFEKPLPGWVCGREHKELLSNTDPNEDLIHKRTFFIKSFVVRVGAVS